MEEVTAYIESGILELYVLGQLTESENKDVEAMIAKFPIIRDELSAIEIALENYAQQNAITPSAHIGDKILAQLTSEILPPASNPTVIPIHTADKGVGGTKIVRYALVACIAALVFCLLAIYSLNQKLNDAKEQIATLSSDKQQFATTVSKLKFENDGMENRIQMYESPEWTTVKLAGVKDAPDAKMLVFWNKNNKNIIINYAAIDLPKTDEAHEYQLWALVDGKPVSLGVFANQDHAKSATLAMDKIQKAQAFAVTIEPNGGSSNPTMDKMVVMGAI